MASGLYVFTNDLRVEYNALLESAMQQEIELLALFVIDPSWFEKNNFSSQMLGRPKWLLIKQGLQDLQERLSSLGVQFKLVYGKPEQVISEQITEYDIQRVYVAKQAGSYEVGCWQQLKQTYDQVTFCEGSNTTLLEQEDIQALGGVKGSFSRFKRKLEPFDLINIRAQRETIESAAFFSSKVRMDANETITLGVALLSDLVVGGESDTQLQFSGGETAAKAHVANYFNSALPLSYKETRNELDGFTNSTKFSPWLAIGNLSPKYLWLQVEHYEQTVDANESTYWIKFELLWREYFYWYARELGAALFQFKGIAKTKPLTTFHAERFMKWCTGSTPNALINACMRQLNNTGFMSNRGRQLTASYLVNELQIDWRYGAAYFQQQLVDFDVASNWGNWQYIAGVGSDPRGGRHFNLDKQTQLYDPNGDFVKKWGTQASSLLLDSCDAVGWPISEGKGGAC